MPLGRRAKLLERARQVLGERLDRQSTEHGAQPWAALRERLADEPWAATALALVDAEDPAIEPLAEDLPRSLEQLRAAPERHDAMRVLGRI